MEPIVKRTESSCESQSQLAAELTGAGAASGVTLKNAVVYVMAF